jgi:hypothetical protein
MHNYCLLIKTLQNEQQKKRRKRRRYCRESGQIVKKTIKN